MTHIKKCFSVSTTHGSTYCETYAPSDGTTTNTTPQVILMVHGCGGSVDHYEQSGIPQLLANQGNTVVCFDWYSHGKSAQVPSKEIKHDLDLFFSQLHDVINSPDLPVSRSKVFAAHAFSMGCYIVLQYCVRYKPFQYHNSLVDTTNIQADAGPPSPVINAGKQGPYINKIVLQSPWDGHVPYLLRGLIQVPLLLRLCKPSDMSGIKSMRTLKQLLLELDHNIDYKQSMEQFADAVLSTGASPRSPSPLDSHTVIDVSSSSSDATSAESIGDPGVGVSKDFSLQSFSSEEGSNVTVACSVLMIAGTRELPFHITARRITKRIRRKLCAQQSPLLGSSTEEEAASIKSAREQEIESKMVHFQFKTCKYASHMSFAKHAEDSYVKNFFHKEISEFIAQKPPVQDTSSK